MYTYIYSAFILKVISSWHLIDINPFMFFLNKKILCIHTITMKVEQEKSQPTAPYKSEIEETAMPTYPLKLTQYIALFLK